MAQTIRSQRLNESYTKIEHSSGLTLLLYPMQGYSGSYALFTTKYGSVDTCFKTGADADFAEVPAGIAHFLEHKMFESEEGDAFARYAATGASANAYTSFDRTAYLFSCSDNFAQSIEILLDFVTKPYFTKETVEKEQGIIGQEIKMYDDSAEWRVFFNLLGALYHHNPVRIDIAGTVETIAEIDAELLYRCYHTFYNLRNMVLAVAGNFEIETVLEAADRILKPAPEVTIERMAPPEPWEVREKRVEQHLPVALPLFQMGFKGNGAVADDAKNFYGMLEDELLLDILAGEATPLYRRLFDAGLINQTFTGEAMAGSGYSIAMMSGESRDPDEVCAQILEEVRCIQREGIDPEAFARTKKMAYGRHVGSFGKVEAVASLLVTTHFSGVEAYDLLDFIAKLTLEQLSERFAESFHTERCALSVVKQG